MMDCKRLLPHVWIIEFTRSIELLLTGMGVTVCTVLHALLEHAGCMLL